MAPIVTDARAFLVQRTGASGPGMRWPLVGSVVTIGRAEDSHVVLDDREVSRRHAQIRHDGSQYVLVDLGSKNGTRVNGGRVDRAVPLADGDEIVFGTRHRFMFMDQDATVPAPSRVRSLSVDPVSRSVTVGGHRVDPPLAPNQFALLVLLASQPGRVFTRDEIAAVCYPDAAGGISDQAIDGVVRRLRARLTETDPSRDHISAIRGHGFKLTS